MVSVKLYSAQSCPFCAMARNFFKGAGVEFEDIDVSKDPDAAEEMVRKSGKMLIPQIEIGDTIIVGFDEEAIKRELGINV
ncbi:Glutaredoxin [Candidatus Methanoperedenaceae archaeon GB37]|nr:Glutaredoxin [Candidatus Methanoperedenaceae archaeon GB37]